MRLNAYRDSKPSVPTLAGLPVDRATAAVTALGLLGTAGEAGLMHFRGAYQDPAMFLPVAVPPLAAGLLGNAALARQSKNRWFTRWWLRLTAALGLAGVGFHAFGVSRNMGGWRNWSQNVLNGPPIPAPPSFTGLALAGLAARGKDGRAPDPLRVDGWMPMRQYPESEAVDFVIVGTGAGGGTLACKLAEHGFSVVAFDAGAWWRPLEEFASDEEHQRKLYWTDERICAGDNPLKLGSNNSGKAVGGSTVHFAMVSLRFRPDWFRSRSKLGYAADWPLDWREMWRYYEEVEQALKIAGPVTYPWGPPRPRYPYRPHEVNAAGLVLARGCEALGLKWTPTPLATVSAPRGLAHPCVYRGFCTVGCSTNAKQSALITWIPRAVRAGAEIRDLAMVGRVETDNKAFAQVCTMCAKGDGSFRRRATSSFQAMRSKRRACC